MRFTLASASTFCRTSHVHVRITGIQMKIERRNTQHSIVIIGQRNADLSGSKLPKRFTQIKSIQDNIFQNFVIHKRGKNVITILLSPLFISLYSPPHYSPPLTPLSPSTFYSPSTPLMFQFLPLA